MFAVRLRCIQGDTCGKPGCRNCRNDLGRSQGSAEACPNLVNFQPGTNQQCLKLSGRRGRTAKGWQMRANRRLFTGAPLSPSRSCSTPSLLTYSTPVFDLLGLSCFRGTYCARLRKCLPFWHGSMSRSECAPSRKTQLSTTRIHRSDTAPVGTPVEPAMSEYTLIPRVFRDARVLSGMS